MRWPTRDDRCSFGLCTVGWTTQLDLAIASWVIRAGA